MSWILFAVGCFDLGISAGSDNGLEEPAKPPTGEDSPAPDYSGTEYDVSFPRYQAHHIVVPIDGEGLVVLDEVEWTRSIADTDGYELCSDALTVRSVEAEEGGGDEDDPLASWIFEVEAPPTGPCSYDVPPEIGVTVTGPDSRLLPFLAPNEAWSGVELYSFALRLDTPVTATLHGVATTDELLAGDALLVEKGPLPAGTYRLEPLIYLDLP